MYILFQYILIIKLYIKKLLLLNILKLRIDFEEIC